MFTFSSITNNDLILIITGVIIFFYTLFTFFLWRQAIKQGDTNLMPLPVIYAKRQEGEVKKKLRIRNLGFGPLLNISIEEWVLNVTDTRDSWRIVLKMAPPNVLARDEERDLITETYKNKIKMDDFDLSPHLDPDFANFYIPTKLTFEDIRGVKYSTIIGLGKGQLSVITPVKRIRNYLKIFTFLNCVIEKFKDIIWKVGE